MDITKTKIFVIVIIIALSINFLPNLYVNLRNDNSSDVLDNLTGEIYYLKRVGRVKSLFKLEDNSQNETLVYSHVGKGHDNYGGYNDNILEFYYDSESKILSFVAMNYGDWSLFELKEGESTPTFIKSRETYTSGLEITDYLNRDTDQLTVIQKDGSLYIVEDGVEKCVKKFYGIGDIFYGYRPIGLSPDGKYLVYGFVKDITLFGIITEGMMTERYSYKYIMELSSGKIAKFSDISEIQWVID